MLAQQGYRGRGPARGPRSLHGWLACAAARGRTTVPILRLDLDRDAERAHDSVPRLIVANWVDGKTT